MTQEHPEQIVMASGKAASSKIPHLEYIPTLCLEKTAERFELGVERKKEKSWNALSDNQKVLLDQEFILSRVAHIIHHALKFRDKLREGTVGDPGSDDDASAIVWGGMFLQCVGDAIQKEKLKASIEPGELREWTDNPKSFVTVNPEGGKGNAVTLPKSEWIGAPPLPNNSPPTPKFSEWEITPKRKTADQEQEIADATLEAGGRCPTDTDGDGDCHHCSRLGVCWKIGEWKVVPLYKEDSVISEVIGYAIRWSTPTPKGEWCWHEKWVANLAKTGSLTVDQCKVIADNERDRLKSMAFTPLTMGRPTPLRRGG